MRGQAAGMSGHARGQEGECAVLSWRRCGSGGSGGSDVGRYYTVYAITYLFLEELQRFVYLSVKEARIENVPRSGHRGDSAHKYAHFRGAYTMISPNDFSLPSIQTSLYFMSKSRGRVVPVCNANTRSQSTVSAHMLVGSPAAVNSAGL